MNGAELKIVQVISSVAPSDGGPTSGSLRLNEALAELGHEAVLLATDADGARGRLAVDHDPDLHGGAAVEVFRRSRPWRLKNSWGLARRTFELAKTADVIHIHGGYLANSAWAYIACRVTGTPYTYQLHGVLEPYQRQFSRYRKETWDFVIGRRILRRASFLVAASTTEAENLRSLIPGVAVVTAPLGITSTDPREPPEQIAAFLSAWLSADKSDRVLFLGRLARKKQPDLLVRAWNEMEVGQLLIVGPEEDWTVGQLSSTVSEARAHTVTISSGVDAQTAAWLMEQAAVFVLPSLNENFAIAVAEAMAHSCAVLTTAETAASEHVLSADSGVVLERADTATISEALTDLLGNPTATAELALRGRRYARERLVWRSTASTLANAWQHIEGFRPRSTFDVEV